MTRIKTALFFLIVVGLLSCNGGNEKLSRVAMVADEASTFEIAEPVKNPPESTIERKVIKRGDIRFRTKSIKETTAFILKNVNDLKGYVSNENVFNSDDRITQRIEIRIPSGTFDVLLSLISENAGEIDYKNVQLQDVTEEYIDIESRIRTKKELENRYRELLKIAKTVEDIVSIEKELGTLRTDIEAIEGRLKYLKDQVSISTLTVEYYEMTSSTINFSSKLGQAVVMGWNYLISFIIGLVHLWPFILIIGILIMTILQFRRRKRKRI